MLTVSELYIYPIKSLAGIAVATADMTSRGLAHDRRLMLVNEDNSFLTQRRFPAMALLQPALTPEGLYLHHKKNTSAPLLIPLQPAGGETVTVTIWDDTCEAILYDAAVNNWFSQVLGIACKLVYMPDTSNRLVDTCYAKSNEVTSFSDGYPTLVIGQSSLDDLNNRLPQPVPMDRFRPNIVFTGGDAYTEDRLQAFNINGIAFNGVKPCARCVMTTIDQNNATVAKEPLKTLATYRLKDNKVLFGQNLLHHGTGSISIGDALQVTAYQPAAV